MRKWFKFIISNEYSKMMEVDERYSEFKLIDQFVGFNYSQGKSVLVKIFEN